MKIDFYWDSLPLLVAVGGILLVWRHDALVLRLLDFFLVGYALWAACRSVVVFVERRRSK
jgi:hypothetical protein